MQESGLYTKGDGDTGGFEDGRAEITGYCVKKTGRTTLAPEETTLAVFEGVQARDRWWAGPEQQLWEQ